MKMELLHIVGCPYTDIAEANARAALDALGLGAVPIELVTIRTEEEAENTRFGGSPTILVDGVDLFPTAPVRSLVCLCQVYATESGFAGEPTQEQIEAALRGASR
ncbi:hypothetical protein WDU99_16960 [Microbacterium sp. Mu-80]|uniref:Thioredoxin family protein n=1 Tax=Microbacterium bandirmense TaxID=3122050 RepID=A0ABU8LHH6_9MICO